MSISRRALLQQLAFSASASPALTLFAQTEAYVLGQSAPITGPAAELGKQFNAGAHLYFDKINAKGGINGRKIELILLDDGYEPERTAANTKQFIKDGVFALFGYIGTPTTLAALPLAVEAKTPIFAPFTGADALRTPFNRYVLHVRASYFEETAAIVRQAAQIGSKKMAVFYQNDAYGKTGLEGITRALAETNSKPVSTGTVERNSVDVAKAVTDILAGSPDAIAQIGAYKGCAAFIREARKAGSRGPFYNVSFVGTQALATELGKEAVGVVVSQVMPFPFTATSPLSGEYLADLAAQSDKSLVPNYSSIEGYVAAKVFTEGLRRMAKVNTKEAFIDAIESISNLSMSGFQLNFSNKSHAGSKYVDLTVLTADGKVRR
jgi:ABC-type branched-subunit amino acid transport system substrate-binding protein